MIKFDLPKIQTWAKQHWYQLAVLTLLTAVFVAVLIVGNKVDKARRYLGSDIYEVEKEIYKIRKDIDNIKRRY